MKLDFYLKEKMKSEALFYFQSNAVKSSSENSYYDIMRNVKITGN